ncbi:MAG: lipoprotein release ABC transporter permease [Bacteroidetes bacterium OLB12]|nr:MAG: lipoprotein release ABC transporter permease [Bacteroidetes bacterium OLB12]
MNLPLFIARRYFFSGRKKNFINLISILSIVGIAFSTAALVIVLSVFNGLEDLLKSLYTSFDPELKIELKKGKSFEVDEALIQRLKQVPGVDIITEVIEDYAYVRYRDADIVVTLKGVSESFLKQHRLDNSMVDGKLLLNQNNIDYAVVGRGVQYALSLSVNESIHPLQVFYIKNLKTSGLDPSQLYTRRVIQPGGVFSIEKNYDDNYIFVPLHFAQDLLNYGNKRTSLEIKTTGNLSLKETQAGVAKVVGENFLVLTNQEQHADLYRLLKIEKLFTFIALTLLILVASINIFFSLMMLVLDKKKDISVLFAMGSSTRLIRNIFLSEGALIAFAGAFAGLLLGGIICWLQDSFGLVGMGMENAIVSSYPVKMKLTDFVLTALVIVLITVLVSFYPARQAARSYAIQKL